MLTKCETKIYLAFFLVASTHIMYKAEEVVAKAAKITQKKIKSIKSEEIARENGHCIYLFSLN